MLSSFAQMYSICGAETFEAFLSESLQWLLFGSSAFEIAAKSAFKEGMKESGPQLLEPMMKVEVVTPEEYMGDVIGELNSRRGQVQEMSTRGNANVVDAMVPLANMFGYVNNLRSLSQGRANYTMQFDHYEQVPSNVADEVKAKLA